ATEKARDGADAGADQEGKDDPDHRDLKVDPSAPDHAGQHVAAEVVGAEGMRQRGRLQLHGGVLIDRVIGGDEGREECHRHEGAEDRKPRQQHRPAPEAGAPAWGKRGRGHSSTLGSRATVTTSARKLMSTVATAKVSATPCTTM